MKMGDIDLVFVSDGTMRLDGGALFGIVPKVIWNKLNPADRRNRVLIGLNCLLIRAVGKVILVDTGLGNKHPLRRRNIYAMKAGGLIKGLKALGLGPEDVDTVLLTHLHLDHAGGCTRRVHEDSVVPTFPKAQYLAQRKDWHEATHSNERSRASYVLEDLLPLEEARQLELLDGDTEVAQGVYIKHTGGHTVGHQMVYIEAGDQRVACLGDVLPTPHHLPLPYVASLDMYPNDTLEYKRRLLAQAEKERWLLAFSHSLTPRAGYLVRTEGKLSLDPREL